MPGTLKPASGESVEMGGGEIHKATMVGRIRIQSVPDDATAPMVLDSKSKMGWLVPTMPFKLTSVSILKQLGYGFSVGIEDTDYLVDKANGKKMVVTDETGVFCFKARGEPLQKKQKTQSCYFGNSGSSKPANTKTNRPVCFPEKQMGKTNRPVCFPEKQTGKTNRPVCFPEKKNGKNK